MGELRNLAIKEIKTEWLLYFSVDDELLPNAVEEILKYKEYDTVTLKYEEHKLDGTKKVNSSAYFTPFEIKNWNKCRIPGYIAVKNKDDILYEEIEIPNYPYLFKLAVNMKTNIETDNVCAVYKRRVGSHGYVSAHTNKISSFAKELDDKAKKYFDIYSNSLNSKQKEELKPIIERDTHVKLRGFKNYKEAVEYSENKNFQKLSLLDRQEFLSWLMKFK